MTTRILTILAQAAVSSVGGVLICPLLIARTLVPPSLDGPVGLSPEDAPAAVGAWTIVSADQNQRRWERTSTFERPDGSTLTLTNSFVELASGLNWLDDQQRWVLAEA